MASASRNRRAGKQREQQWLKRLRRQGWEAAFVPRDCGEPGCDDPACSHDREQHYDILAVKGRGVVCWEVKSTAAGPFSDFGPAKREACIQAALRAGGSPALVWWPYDRNGPRVYAVAEWPSSDEVNGGLDVWPEGSS